MVREEQLLAWGELPRYNSYSLLVSHFLLYGWISIFSRLCGHRFVILVWLGGSICLSGFNDTWFQENLNENLRSGRKTGRENFSRMVRNREERKNEFFWRLRGFRKFFEAGWCWYWLVLVLAGADCWLVLVLAGVAAAAAGRWWSCWSKARRERQAGRKGKSWAWAWAGALGPILYWLWFWV